MMKTLWQTFDNGTWVAPQLAAAAFLQDPLFEERARARIMDDYERQYDKALAALVGLCRLLPSSQAWLDEALALEARQKAVTDEWDKGDEIAAHWLRNFQKAQAEIS